MISLILKAYKTITLIVWTVISEIHMMN